jgi:hypothetical protein
MENSELQPPYEQFALGITGKTSDVGTAEGKSGYRQALTLDIGNL